MKTKVLILYSHIGYGIKMTAEAVAEKLNKSSRYEVKMADVEELERGLLSWLIEKAYALTLAHLSRLWGLLYDSRTVLALTLPLRKPMAAFKSSQILKILRQFQPAIVISTGVTPSSIIAYLKSKRFYQGKFVIVFSDYHLQRFWLYQEADLYICNIPEQLSELAELKVPKEKTALSGTLIMDKFFEPITKEQSRQKLGLLVSMPVVLLTSGGSVRNSIKDIFLQLLRSPKAYQIAVVCGRNRELKHELEKISSPSLHPVRIFEYVENMEVVMSAADVLVGKTGGPTMAEAVAKKLPMVLTDVRPGHELKNLEYLLQHGIAQYARIPKEVEFLVEQILNKKIIFDHSRSFSQIIRPPSGRSFTELIDEINPSQKRP